MTAGVLNLVAMVLTALGSGLAWKARSKMMSEAVNKELDKREKENKKQVEQLPEKEAEER